MDLLTMSSQHGLDTDAPRSAGRTPDDVLIWLEEAWRHGEVIADAEGISLDRAGRPADRFRVLAGEYVQ